MREYLNLLEVRLISSVGLMKYTGWCQSVFPNESCGIAAVPGRGETLSTYKILMTFQILV